MPFSAENSAGVPAVAAPQPPRWVAVLVSGGFFVLLTYVLTQQVRVHLSDIFAVALAGLVFLGIVLTADRLLERSEWLRRHQRLAMVAGFVVVFAVQLVFVRELYATVGWDPRAVFAAAIDLANFNQSPIAALTPEWYTAPGLTLSYWGAYPNNLMLAFTYEVVFRICAALGIPSAVFLSTALNVLVLDMAILLATLCARRLWGASAARITLLIAVPFLGFSPWISIAYSDTMATVFPVLLLYLYLRYVEAKPGSQYLFAAMIGAVSAVGYLIKPHVISMTLAIGLVHLLSRGTPGSRLPSKLMKLAVVAVVAATVMGGFGAYRDYRMRDRITEAQFEALRFPVSHFIAMSLNHEKGGYNAKDVEEQRALTGLEAKNERNIRVIRARLKELGFFGYAAYAHRKLTWITTDGTLFWQYEGRPTEYVPFHDGRYAQMVQSVFYRDGAHYRWFALAANGVWLALLFAMVAPVATQRRWDRDGALLVARLAVIILLLMLLVLEGRSRYLISFTPVLILLSSYQLSSPALLGRWSILQRGFDGDSRES